MKNQIFTIGFTRKTLEEFIGLLKQAGVREVVDIRLRNTSQLAGWAKYPDFSYLLREGFGIGYSHNLQFAPTGALLDQYKLTKDWEQYEQGFRRLLDDRRLQTEARDLLKRGRICLLCAEPAADRCHRRLVSEFIAKLFPKLEVVHL